MEFFNKKEQVIDFQLTAYGREKYAKGDFEPVFYAFFDDSILYNSEFAGQTGEVQNDVQKRIKDQTPYMRDISLYYSAEDILKLKNLNTEEKNPVVVPLMHFDNTNENILSTSKNNEDKAPAWKITFLRSEMDTDLSKQFLREKLGQRSLPVPQLEIKTGSIEYKIKYNLTETIPQEELDLCETDFSNLFQDANVFEDGTSITIEAGEDILLKIEEENNFNFMDNYEVEFFEEIVYNDVNNNKQTFLKPLKFFKFQEQIQDGIMLDVVDERKDLENLEKIDDTFLSYYLDVDMDENIEPELICQYDKDRKQDPFIRSVVNCDEVGGVLLSAEDIYEELDDGDLDGFLENFDEECE